jgi:hypothetical protein
MAAIISDKFRIFNAKQFLESLSEGPTVNPDQSDERTRMYFFVGRPQPWKSYLEIYSNSGGNFTVGNEVYAGTYNTFRGTIAAVYDSALLLTDIFGANGVGSTSTAGSTLIETADGGASGTGVTAKTGVYRYATEEIPPFPLDNLTEKRALYDEIIAAKRIYDTQARTVIRRYNYDFSVNPKFDMWKPDYSETLATSGRIGKAAATSAESIADAKFYVMNSDYEVFKCLYNGENPTNLSGQNVSEQPSRAGANYNSTTGIYTETTGAGYIWKFMYKIETNDVLKFLSSDFMPIALPSDTASGRPAVTAAAVAGAADVVLIEDPGANFPAGETLYTPILGDGSGGVVEFTTDGTTGEITGASVVARGSGYTYANILLINGNVYEEQALSTTSSVGGTATGALEIVLPPQGGHGADHETELNGKRVMTNIRLTYDEGSGDFPVDNDFRRIGIIRDPKVWGGSSFLVDDTATNLRALKVDSATADFIPDEVITQTVTGGTAKGTVVSWTLDEGSTTAGVLKYIQTTDAHTDQGVVRGFESNGVNAVSGELSAAAGNVDIDYFGPLLGVEFPGTDAGSATGIANPEIENNSGDVIYIENRRLITRAPDQIEDIKLVIEF